MKHYSLGLGKIRSIRRHSSRNMEFSNVDIALPCVNGLCLTVGEAYGYLQQNPMLASAEEATRENIALMKPADSTSVEDFNNVKV